MQPATSTLRKPEQARIPSEIWRRLSTDAAPRRAIPRGMDAAWNAAVGDAVRLTRRPGRYMREAAEVRERAKKYTDLSDRKMRETLEDMRACFRLGQHDRDQVREAYAMVCEAAVRAVGLLPHQEQVAGALAIHDGCISELATGEGKTLVATMPAVVAGWRGRGCHVLTFNDYLARRDAEIMTPVYEYCGLRVESIAPEMKPADRRHAYLADITYCTNQDVAADYLRDRLALGRHTRLAGTLLSGIVDGRGSGISQLVTRGLDTAIVDEADSILVDEAVTPLILSADAPNDEQEETFRTAARIARDLTVSVDYEIDHRYREVKLTRRGQEKLTRLMTPYGGFWASRRRREEVITQGLTAREFFLRDHQYVVEDGKVVIVDESTGRLMPDRTWRAGIHQAVEAKENLKVNPPKETMARVSFQRFFRMYRHLAGMTGTAWEARYELWQIFGLTTVVIPTHRTCRRKVEPDRIYPDTKSKWAAILEEIKKVHAEGRPVLVGTRSVDDSEAMSRRLAEAGLEHQVLNAVRHAEEAEIVSRAGGRGRITVATNMAGRGTDIKLDDEVRALGGLHVIATERHESRRIDRQLFGRAARQGDPGSAVAFVSHEDEILRRYSPMGIRRITLAQKRAERLGARQRQSVLRTDDWLDRYLGFAGRL